MTKALNLKYKSWRMRGGGWGTGIIQGIICFLVERALLPREENGKLQKLHPL